MVRTVTVDEVHNITQMIEMYEAICTQLRTLKEDTRVVSVYVLYDCVSLILAHMIKSNPTFKFVTYNSQQLLKTTLFIHKDDLNRMFIDFDKDFYGTVYLTVAMDAVRFNDCQKKLFWLKGMEYLSKESLHDETVTAEVTSEKSFDPERVVFSPDTKRSPVGSEQSFDPDEHEFNGLSV
jgi:hypothetical protein